MWNPFKKKKCQCNGTGITQRFVIPIDKMSMTEDMWNELTTQEKLDRNKPLPGGFVDWNKFELDELCDYLEEKYMFSSSGEAFAIFKLIEFYKNNK